ncbi:MAG: DsbA family protein [Alphaproteobacteria bacterium]|nr:DsbA family protein [Alphaproteobacteria bacterium]
MTMGARATWMVAGLLLGAAAGAAGYAAWSTRPAPIAVQAPDPEAARVSDVNERIAANWGALAAAPGDPVIGNPDGDVTIVEFFDYACSYCKAAEPRLVAAIESDARVRLVLKEFPILTPESMTATQAALAAQMQGKYQPFHQALMRYQGELTEAVIFGAAQDAGLDMARLKQDMQAPAVAQQIIANFNLARAIRAYQTPTFIAGNRLAAHVLSSTSASIDFPQEIAAARGN